MQDILGNLLHSVVDNYDCGNSNLTEEETLKAINYVNELSRKDKPLSKYQACKYLNISRATFDNLVKEGKLPQGDKQQGKISKSQAQRVSG